MENKIARISWKRGQYLDVYCSTIIDPSPLKGGQKVKVVWGKTRKECAAVVACYPLEEETQQISTEEQSELPSHQAQAKRKLVSFYLVK